MTAPSSATLELLQRLVALDTTSAVSNLPLLDVVEEHLADARVERVHDPGGSDKAGLLARIGPDVDGGVVLSAHTDCVPVEDQPWSGDPFALREVDGRLVGRGTTDMKGFLAAVLAHAAPAAAAAPLRRPLWLLCTYDEEVGALSSEPLTRRLLQLTTPAAAIVGEPTSLRPVTAHKGVRPWEVVVTGRDGHSSKPQLAASALLAAARIALRIDEVAGAHRRAAAAPEFDPPCTTFNVATLHSGQAINIVPRRAELTFEYRPVPADDGWDLGEQVAAWAREHVVPGLREVDPQAGVAFERGAAVPALRPEQDGAAERLVRELTGDTDPAGTVPFGTDGGWHQQLGVSTVVCGPGDIEQAHTPDEWIEPAQLAACETFLERLVERLCGDPIS